MVGWKPRCIYVLWECFGSGRLHAEEGGEQFFLNYLFIYSILTIYFALEWVYFIHSALVQIANSIQIVGKVTRLPYTPAPATQQVQEYPFLEPPPGGVQSSDTDPDHSWSSQGRTKELYRSLCFFLSWQIANSSTNADLKCIHLSNWEMSINFQCRKLASFDDPCLYVLRETRTVATT